MKKIILVTGSGGVTGKALFRISNIYKQYKFIFSNSNDFDLRDLKKTVNFIKYNKINKIINFAAVSGGIGLRMSHHASMLRDNVLININILEASVKCKIEKTILCLTTGMYPEKAKLPLSEIDIQSGPPSSTNYGSSYAKRLIEPAIKAYRDEFKLNVIGLIPSGIYGPEDNFNKNDAPMLPSIINRMYDAKFQKKKLEVWGTGKPLREYTYSEDIAKIFMWALKHYNKEQVLNIGTTEENSIKNIVYLIADKLKFPKKEIAFNHSKPDGIYKKSSSNKLFIQEIKKFKYTSLKSGISKTIDWFLESKNKKIKLKYSNKIKKFKI
jgi:GDP-L-fucose synthase